MEWGIGIVLSARLIFWLVEWSEKERWGLGFGDLLRIGIFGTENFWKKIFVSNCGAGFGILPPWAWGRGITDTGGRGYAVDVWCISIPIQIRGTIIAIKI